MPENCTFWIARYVPDAVRGEFLTVGVLLFCGDPQQFVGARWTEDWCLAQFLDPAVNLELLQAMCHEITNGLKNGRDIRELAMQGQEAIQFSGPTACVVPDATT